MKIEVAVAEGVLEAIGPGQVGSDGSLSEYVDLGGRRLPPLGWSRELGYYMDKSLGKKVRLATWRIPNRIYGVVAGIEVDGKVFLADKQPIPNLTTKVVLWGAFGLFFGIGAFANAAKSGHPVAGAVGLALLMWPAVHCFLRKMRIESAHEKAKASLGSPVA